jgi:hypothetical protein
MRQVIHFSGFIYQILMCLNVYKMFTKLAENILHLKELSVNLTGV